MKSNLHLFTDKTATGIIAGVAMTDEEYRSYYNSAIKDFDGKKRRIKSNYLIEKLKEYEELKDFEYKYIYDASCARNTSYLLFQIIPLAIIMVLHFNGPLGLLIGIFCSAKLIFGILYNVGYWLPMLDIYKDKHEYIKGCFMVNISTTVIYAISIVIYLLLLFKK